MKPDRIIIGTDNPRTTELLRELYAPFNRNRDRLIAMDIRSAELTKYAANAMLATKISFMNELSNLAERLGADIEQVRHGIGSDSRIGYSFIYPGCGYGGSCFPKDVSALERTAHEVGYDAQLLSAVEAVNAQQKRVIFNKIHKHFAGDLQGKSFALWGLAFKPNTDDMRDAPSIDIAEALLKAGATVRGYDPVSMLVAGPLMPGVEMAPNPYSLAEGADALIVVTEWNEFKQLDLERVKRIMTEPVIFDGRNIYDPDKMQEQGFSYRGVGRGYESDSTPPTKIGMHA
jgi:UDPglucose 6-dehydrogenase